MSSRASSCARRSPSPASRTTRSSAWTRSCAPPRVFSSAVVACWNGGPRATPNGARPPVSRAPTRPCGSCRTLAVVVTTGLALRHPGALPVAGPVIVLWMLAPATSWWLSRADTSAPSRAVRRRLGVPAHRRSAHLAVLRDVRRPRRQLPAARQFPGGSAARDRAPHVADQHRPGASGEPGSLRLRLRHRRRGHRPDEADAWRPWTGCSDTAGTSTTGTTRARLSRCGRSTFRRSTAATWPATCSRSPPVWTSWRSNGLQRGRGFSGLATTLDVIAGMAAPASADLLSALARMRAPLEAGAAQPIRHHACS